MRLETAVGRPRYVRNRSCTIDAVEGACGWSDYEVWRWLEWLALRRATRVRLILEMLQHRYGDGMSAEDEAVCVRGLQLCGLTVRRRAYAGYRIQADAVTGWSV